MFVERSFLRAKRAELEGRVGYGTRMVNIAGERACVADDCCGNERAGRLVVFALKGRCRALKAFDAPIHIAHRDIGSIKLSVTERGFHCAQIGRAHLCTPVTTAYIVCRLLLSKK